MFQSEFKQEVCNPLHIEDLFEAEVTTLSGGELQRLAIALCLGKDVDVYLLDEPSAYLDIEYRLIVSKIIKRFVYNHKKTAFIVEHDFTMSMYLADKIIVFSGISGENTTANEPNSVQDGMNIFLKQLNLTLRKDSETNRPRINKLSSVLDQEQKLSSTYYLA